MPFNRRVPFFNINKSQHAWDTLRQNELLKKRSNSQKPYNVGDYHNYFYNGFNNNYDDDGYEDDLQSEKLFHTICVGNTNESSSISNPCLKNANWVQLEETIINLFKNNGYLSEGKLKETHDNITLLLNSNFGILVFERFKSQVLPKAVRLLKVNINDDEHYLETLAEIWKVFYHQILPMLECMLYSVEPINNVSIRKTTLVIFRDQIIVNGPLENKIKALNIDGKPAPTINDTIVHMILIVQSILERYPPSENKLQMERLAALVVTPFIGYRGIYMDFNQTPIIKSKEPFNNNNLCRTFDNLISKPLEINQNHFNFDKQPSAVGGQTNINLDVDNINKINNKIMEKNIKKSKRKKKNLKI